jgi:hypothetical protein
MRCLFCGKELALLKRLRGGGEFCSEAHRKEYQEQYEQLALARLLQAKPPAEPPSQGQVPFSQPFPTPMAAPDALPKTRTEVPAPARPEPQAQSRSSVRMIEAPQPAEEAGPAPLAGFVGDPVVPAVTTFQHAGSLELERVTTPSLPAAVKAPDSVESLPRAPRVEFEFSLQALDHHTRTSERGMELREFAGPALVMDLHSRPATGTEPTEAADVMEILMSPQPPQKATPWLGLPRGFPAAPAELGQLARLDFTTTGFAYSDGPVSARGAQPVVPQAAVSTPEAPQIQEPVLQAPPAEPPAPAETPAPAQPAPPPLVTKALPVTLHGLAAPRGQLAQTFTSAITAASDVQIPPPTALPLRPAIVFGPAPAPKPTASPVQRVPEQAKPVPEKTESSFRSSVVPVPKGVPVKRSAAPETVTPEIKAPKVAAPAADTRVEPPKDSPAPKPFESPAVSDAGLPSLRMEATESAWSKLSMGLKMGVAAAVILGLFGIAYLVTRGGGKTTNQAPVAAAPAAAAVASGVPISGGWIDDWANVARSRRRISVLSGSAKLSDYRMEFQAQIQTRAIGWIFRGLNPRNYYVTKLEAIKPGLEPTVALVHFAVVDGMDENRVVVPLPMKVRVDTTYKIRFEAIGNRFTTWVQDQKIDEWTDSRFGSGGVGLFSDRDEQAAMQGNVNVVALVPKN